METGPAARACQSQLSTACIAMSMILGIFITTGDGGSRYYAARFLEDLSITEVMNTKYLLIICFNGYSFICVISRSDMVGVVEKRRLRRACQGLKDGSGKKALRI